MIVVQCGVCLARAYFEQVISLNDDRVTRTSNVATHKAMHQIAPNNIGTLTRPHSSQLTSLTGDDLSAGTTYSASWEWWTTKTVDYAVYSSRRSRCGRARG